MRDRLDQLVRKALIVLAERDGLDSIAGLDPGVEHARDPQHGDYASSVALRAAQLAERPPRDLAQALVACLPDDPAIAEVGVAGPGFINFRVAASAWYDALRAIVNEAAGYGTAEPRSRGRVLVEYLSANPTGPLHVGHGRIAAYGASLVSLLRAAGFEVDDEYYINDAGRQMDILATSVWLRYAGQHGALELFPANCYQGAYVSDIAGTLAARHGEALLGDVAAVTATIGAFGEDGEKNLDSLIATLKSVLGADGFATVLEAAVDEILGDIRNDLADFGAAPEHWFSEQSLTTSGAVDAAIERLRLKGLLYEKDGPTWFRSTDFGDDKDRVVVRANGIRTYFASDIAYHIDKFERGYDQLINVVGSDHHGYMARVKASVAAAGYEPERLEFRLVQFVVLYRGQQKVQMTTRGGTYVTLRELRQEVGNDAARFFYVSRSNDQHLEFDLELAKAETSDNPVYYIQYAHARIASMLDRLDGALPDPAATDLGPLSADGELALIRLATRYPEIVELAAAGRAPQHLVHYLRDLAAEFHAYYNAQRILTDDRGLRDARILLAAGVQQVIRNGLSLLGVSAPESM